MNFGLFNLMPRRDTSKSPQQLALDSMELCQMAEQLDFDTVWFAEHHFSNYCMIPSPLIMSAYCAARTKRINVGPAVLVLPLYEPVRLIEEIAFVDQISDGRLQLGVGGGYQNYEFRQFGRDLKDGPAMFSELLDMIEMAYRTGEIHYQGKHFKIDHTPIGLQPQQKPMPQVYVAGLTQDISIQERIARNNYVPFIGQHHRPASTTLKSKEAIAKIWTSVGRSPEDMAFATQRFIYVTKNRNEEIKAAENIRYTLRLGAGLRANAEQLDGAMLRELPFRDEPSLEEIIEFSPIGSPERVASILAEDFQLLNPTHVSFMFQFGSLPHRSALRSMELFGTEVLPMLSSSAHHSAPTVAAGRHSAAAGLS